MKYFLFFTFVWIQFSPLFSISEDQFGESDWIRKQIGYIDKIVYQNKSIYVSTLDHVLASINIRSGELDWRVILPNDNLVEEIIADKSSVYTLSAGGLLQAWSALNGELLWSQSFHSDKFSPVGGTIQTLSIDSNSPVTQIGVIYALYQNCFFAISPLKGQILSQFCPNIEIPSTLVTPTVTNKEFHLSTIISHPGKILYNKPYPILTGSLESSNGESKFHFALSISISNRALAFADLSIFPAEGQQKIGFQQQKYFSYFFNPQDAKFTLTTLANPPVVFVVDLSSKLSSTNSAYEISLHNSVFETSIVQICQKSDMSPTFQSCVFLSIEKGSDDSLFAREIHSFRDGHYYTSLEEDYSQGKSGIVKNILSLSVPLGSTDVHLALVTTHPSGQHTVTRSTFTRSLFPGIHSSLSHLSFSTYQSKSSSETIVKLLVQSSSGALSLMQQGRGVRWTREEGLSRVRQGVILDNPTTLENKGLTSIPTFEQRLQLQVEDLKSKIASLHSSIQSIPQTISALIYESLPPNMAASLMPNFKAPRKAVDVNVELFGFNKISVQLTSRCAIDGKGTFSKSEFVDCLSGFQIVALDLVEGSILWSFIPDVVSLPVSFMSKFTQFSFTANLLKIRLHSRATHPAELGLLISVEGRFGEDVESVLFTYQFHGLTGAKLIGKFAQTCVEDTCKDPLTGVSRAPDRVLLGAGHVRSIQLVDAHLSGKLQNKDHSELNHYQHSTQHYLLMHAGSTPSVSFFPPFSTPTIHLAHGSSLYTHMIHRGLNVEGLTSFKVNFESYRTLQTEPHANTPPIPIYLYSLQTVGNVIFTEDSESAIFQERIVSVVYPQPHEPVHQMAKVLGDDSLLLKYLNPHMIVFVTEKRKEWFDEETSSETEANDAGNSEDTLSADELYITVVDSVSAEIIYRGSILHASQPVVASLIENTIAVSYWNIHAQRFELSSIHLYEGMIGKYGLGPTSSKMDATRSAFNSPPPIALQKSFILPRGVTVMHHTVTERGITNKNLLMGLSTGQILALDTRVIDPRRPLGTPSAMEKEEGLMQYMPFLMWTPLQMLTVNMSLPAIETIITASSHLESTSLVLSYGTDVFFTRATPSKGFDMLASDFNKPLLALIVGGMALLVFMLKNYNNKRILNKQWV